jgi:hypothetical protein
MTEKAASNRAAIKWYLWLTVIAAFIFIMLYLYYILPHKLIGPRQPIYFSHRVHAGVKEINCRFCHPYVERSVHAGLPEVSKCFFCHTYIIPQHPQIVKEREHLETGKPMQWVRIFYLPDYVKFNHERHIRRKFDCSKCHGDVKTMDRLERVEFEMGFCVSCHRENKAQLDCWLACHN